MSNIAEALKRGTMDEASRELFNKHFSHCEIALVDGVERGVTYLAISPVWNDVTRPHTWSWCVGEDELALAQRLQRAVETGAAFCSLEIRTDVNGATYMGTTSTVLGRTMESDLTVLGF